METLLHWFIVWLVGSWVAVLFFYAALSEKLRSDDVSGGTVVIGFTLLCVVWPISWVLLPYLCFVNVKAFNKRMKGL